MTSSNTWTFFYFAILSMLAATPPRQKMVDAAHTCILFQSYSKAGSWRKGQKAAFPLHISVQIKEESPCQMTFNNLVLKLWSSDHTVHHLGTH